MLITKLIPVILAFCVFVGSTGLTLKKHYCQQQLESISLLPSGGCCQSKSHKACKMSASECKKGCCDNEVEYIHLDQDLQVEKYPNLSLRFSADFQASSLILTQQFWAWSRNHSTPTFKPPLLKRNIAVLFQVFRC